MEIKGVYTFSKDICPKVNVIAWLELELNYFETAVQHVSHKTTGTPFRWIYSFLKGINVQGNANSLVLDLKSAHHIHFLRY